MPDVGRLWLQNQVCWRERFAVLSRVFVMTISGRRRKLYSWQLTNRLIRDFSFGLAKRTPKSAPRIARHRRKLMPVGARE